MLNIQEIIEISKQKGIKLSYLNTLINGYRGKLTDVKNGKSTLTNDELLIIEKALSINEQKNKPSSFEDSLTDEEFNLVMEYRKLTQEEKNFVRKSVSAQSDK